MKKSWYEKNIDFYVHALAYWWSTHPTWTAQYPWKKVLQIRTKLTFKLFFRYQSYQLNQALLVLKQKLIAVFAKIQLNLFIFWSSIFAAKSYG